MLIGAQLYTVYDYCRSLQDLSETLKKIADIGYRTVHVSGTCDYEPQWLDAELKKNGLTCAITHYDENRIFGDTDRVIADHDVFGCKYIGISGFPGGTPKIADFIPTAIPMAEKMQAAGKKLMYHNHNWEYEERAHDGRTVMEYLSEEIPASLMGFTLDLYWVQFGGADPISEIRRLSGRLECVHLKDMLDAESRKMCWVGNGSVMNYEKIVTALADAGTEFALVEQDTCYGENPFDCLKKSYDYLTSLGLK